MNTRLTHIDEDGSARMVDVSQKPIVHRSARATGRIDLAPETVAAIRDKLVKKGDVLTVAEIAGTLAAKRTGELIPLCHPIPIDHVAVVCTPDDRGVAIEASATCVGRTGIEMEVITAVSIAAVTIYDMCKAIDKQMTIGEIRLVEKRKEAHVDDATTDSIIQGE